jgi:hypothetical protein
MVGEGAAHDRHERVVAALRGGSGERMVLGAIAVFGAAGGDVGVVFEFAELPEDRFEFHVDERVAAAAVEMQ